MHKVYYKLLTAVIAFNLLLGSWNNHVALYMTGDPEPLEVYPVKLEMLPMADQESLISGIPVENSKKLHQLLQDMLS